MKKLILLQSCVLCLLSCVLTVNAQNSGNGYVYYNSLSNLPVSAVTLQPKQTSDNTISEIPFTGLTGNFNSDSVADRKNINGDAEGSYLWSDKTVPPCPNRFQCGTTYTDSRVSNTYTTVQIGIQCWLQQNLYETSYVNGDAIPNLTANTSWANALSGAYCCYTNSCDGTGGCVSVTAYGYLYNWYAANDSRSLCPLGWFVPSYNDWNILFAYLGGTSVAGVKMEETATLGHWGTGGNNSSGFTARGGGVRADWWNCSACTNSPVLCITYGPAPGYSPGLATFWSSSVTSPGNAWYLSLPDGGSGMGMGPFADLSGFSVRCVKDN